VTALLTLGSLFDGIGGFPLAGVRQGFTPVWASEIELFPIEVTKKRFPDMLHVGDIMRLKGSELTPVDVVCGGSPCQDLSVANGRRLGLQGERSGLFMEQIRVIKEMRAHDKATGRTDDAVRPRYMVWENVPGAFSCSNGEDFRAVLEETCRVADSTVSVPRPPGGVWQSAGAILGEKFSVAWRVYDAQYWSVPQRRKRIFLVADFGGRTAPQILFEQDRLLGDSAAGKETRQGAAACPETGSGDSGRSPGDRECLTPWDVQSRRIYESGGVWPSLYSGGGGGHGYVTTEKENLSALESPAVAFACNQRDEVRNLNNVAGAIQAQPGMKQQTFIAETPKLSDVNCLTPWDTQQGRVFTEESVAPTLAGADGGGGRNPGGLLLTAGFCAGAGPSAGGIGYQDECSPTLKASESGTNMVPSVLCLNDQGGSVMDVNHNISGTLRANERGHQPLVMATQQGGAEIGVGICPTITSAAGTSGNNQPVLFENYGIDSRYTGPHEVAPTMSARYGTGGNNVPLISQPSVFLADSGEDAKPAETYCIAGNIIDRQDQNGGNGIGVQPNISYTVTATDRHCVFSQQRSDEYARNEVVSTQSARQYKDATDLVCETDVAGLDCRNGSENGDLSGTLQSKTSGGYSLNNVHPVRIGKLIRRLTPLECERLQGFPDFWTDIPGASDSARYKALGNSVAIPCVEHVLRGVAYFLRKSSRKRRFMNVHLSRQLKIQGNALAVAAPRYRHHRRGRVDFHSRADSDKVYTADCINRRLCLSDHPF
jgi:DNA (cytosine-5)-methyltransferase 1